MAPAWGGDLGWRGVDGRLPCEVGPTAPGCSTTTGPPCGGSHRPAPRCTTASAATGACDDTFVDVEAAPNGDVWALLDPHDTGEWLLGRFDGEVWTTYTPPFEHGESWLIDGMAVGPDGRVWFAPEDGLVSFDGTDWTTHLQGQEVLALDVAPDGTVWYIDEDGAHTLGEGASP